MKVAVTGGGGFIGSKLVLRLLEQGHCVNILSRMRPPDSDGSHPKLQHFQADLCSDRPDLDAFLDGVSLLFHCAGEIKDELAMQALHVDGTRNLIDQASGKIQHWIQLSSVGAYGPQLQGIITEDTQERPIGTYERTKTQSDGLVLEAAANQAFKCTILRPANVIGANMPNRSVFQMIEAIDRGVFAFIGPSGAMTNYVSVEDVVKALILCAQREAESPEIYNLAEPLTLEEFVGAICSALHKPPPRLRLPKWLMGLMVVVVGKIPGFPLNSNRIDALTNRARYDATKISQQLAYTSEKSVVECVAEMVRTRKNAI